MESLIVAIVTVVGLVIVLAGAVYVAAKTQGMGSTMTLLKEGNEGLTTLLETEKSQRSSDKQEFQLQLLAQEKECDKKLAHMQGQVDTLMSDFVDRLSGRLIEAVAAGFKKGQETS